MLDGWLVRSNIPSALRPRAALNPGRNSNCLLLVVLFHALGLSAQGQEDPVLSIGPIYHDVRMALSGGVGNEAAGPFWASETVDQHRVFGVRPFYVREEDPSLETVSWDSLYPFLTYDRFGAEYRIQLFQLLSVAGGGSQSGATSDRVTVFPFFFSQRSTNPTNNYTAFLPFYGHLRNRLFRDEVDFVAWPLYVRTRKQDVVTRNYLVPFVHKREGTGLSGWQVWPIIGIEHRQPTTYTNGFGDTELKPGHDKHFVAWPLYFHNRVGLGTTNPANQLVSFPLFSRQTSPARDSSSYLLPIGLTITDDREKGYHEVGFPWPFVMRAWGPGKTAARVWPLFGRAHNEYLESEFYLWPLYKRTRAHADPLDRSRLRILLFLYSDIIEKNTATGKASRRTDLWPLFTSKKDADGNERHQFLALLEPYIPNNKSLERSWSPLWSIWRSEKNAKAGTSSSSFLWNLYRTEKTPVTSRSSALFGLIQRETGPEGTSWKWLHLFRTPKRGGAVKPLQPAATESKPGPAQPTGK